MFNIVPLRGKQRTAKCCRGWGPDHVEGTIILKEKSPFGCLISCPYGENSVQPNVVVGGDPTM